MVLQKRLDYGFNGYQVPPTPRATRSARRRGSVRKKADVDQMCAFDLLATVAGKLLLGGGTPSSTDIVVGGEQTTVVKDFVSDENRDENRHEGKLLKEKPSVEGTYAKNLIVSELVSNAPFVNDSTKEFSHVAHDTCSGLASVITSSHCSEKDGFAEKLVHGDHKIEPAIDVGSSAYRVPSCFGSEDDSKKDVKVEPANTGNVLMSAGAGKCSVEGPVIWDSKTSALVTSENSVKFPLCADIPCASIPVCRDDVKLAIRDDDENSSGCTRPSTMNKALRPPPRIGNRRIRKLLTSKYWKVTPRMKYYEQSRTDAEVKDPYHNRNNCYKRQWSQRDYPFKKRKLYDRSSASYSDGGISSDGTSSLPGKDSGGDDFSLGGKMHEASGMPNAAPSEHASFQPRDSHVKLKIKSFRVPELFIEIPETATVGSLKTAVMEAVTAILSGGLHVGVLLQGKKIRDDNKTLLQTGIVHDNKPDALGFTLEPNSSQTSLPAFREDLSFLLPCDTRQSLTRYPPAPKAVHTVGQHRRSDATPEPPMPNPCNFIESDHDSAPSPPDVSVDKNAMDSRAIVAVPAMNVGALAVVPMRKSKRSEAVQRRIRRPFSVSEVEALVQAVEKLGTGRWRDVKLRAFDNAKHRTYVDLKDKWKTLVHTARISPQQRRGEPVPQQLLDRVLTAHAYWSQQQAKQQLKLQQPDTRLLL